MKSIKLYQSLFPETSEVEVLEFFNSDYYSEPYFQPTQGGYWFHWGNSSFVLGDSDNDVPYLIGEKTILLILSEDEVYEIEIKD